MPSPLPQILDDLRAGRMIILTDDENRENEGDLVLPAQFATPEAVNFMLTVARGYLCLSLTERDCDRLRLHPQAPDNTAARGTAFTVSIDGHPRHGFTTGVSAKERSMCVRMAIDPAFGPDDFVRPGHINPLRSRDGGVLVRTGQTEGSVDLCRLAGLYPAAMIIEIMRDDGEMARLPDLRILAEKHSIKICTVAQIIEHRLARESLVRRVQGPRSLTTPWGRFDALLYRTPFDHLPHLVLAMGVPVESPGHDASPTLVRMHRRHLLGDVFHALESPGAPDTGALLGGSMERIAREGRGVLVYLRPSHPPDMPPTDLESLLQSIAPSSPAPGGAGASAPATQRDFGIGGQILRDLGLTRLRLLTNRPRALPGLEAFGLEVVEHVPVTLSERARP